MSTLTFPEIERPDDGLAVVALTGPIDDRAATVVRDILANLAEEGRRYVALDLAGTQYATHTALASLHRQVAKQRADGGDVFLISPGGGVAAILEARAFMNRGFWERYGGLAATPKPHPTRYATRELVLRDAVTHYGVPIVETGEDGEWAFTLGHHGPRRFLAAILAHVRTTCGCDPVDVGLDSINDLAEFGEKARGFSVIYAHAGRVVLGDAKPGDEDADRCVCEQGGWFAAEAAGDAPHAVPTMTYWIGG